MIRAFIIILVVAAALPLAAQDVVVTRRDGAIEGGSFLGAFAEGLRWGVGPAGLGEGRWNEVADVATREEVRLDLVGGEVLRARILRRDGDALIVRHAIFGETAIPFDRLGATPAATPGAEPRPAAPGDAPLDPKDWTGKVALGVSATGGNSDTVNAALEAFLEKNFTQDHLEFALRVIYGKSNGEENANSQLVRGKWEHHYDERLYTFIGAELSRDEIQEISFRGFLNVGVGYRVWQESDKEFLALEGGLGYRHESFTTDTPSRDDVTARAALIYRDIWWGKAQFGQTLEFVAPLTDLGSFFARSETSLSVPVSESWSVRNSIVLNYQNDPPSSAEALDWLITAGVEYSF
ncbi:MAG: DUF481 domain-containing protein [Planctomycetota bacterium]